MGNTPATAASRRPGWNRGCLRMENLAAHRTTETTKRHADGISHSEQHGLKSRTQWDFLHQARQREARSRAEGSMRNSPARPGREPAGIYPSETPARGPDGIFPSGSVAETNPEPEGAPDARFPIGTRTPGPLPGPSATRTTPPRLGCSLRQAGEARPESGREVKRRMQHSPPPRAAAA
jgi:hypothetical protein